MSLTDWVSSSLSGGGLLALPVAFAAGVLMGFNPCCIAMFPAAAATCCAGSCGPADMKRPVIENASLFVLGNAVAITVLGVLAAAIGRTLGGLGGWVAYVVALVPIAMGLHLLGWIRIPMPNAFTAARRKDRLGSFGAGMLLSLVIGPCGTPALAAILAYAAAKASIPFAAVLLFLYGLGNSLPLLVVGTAAGGLAQRLQRLGWSQWVERGAGLAMVVLGLSLLWMN